MRTVKSITEEGIEVNPIVAQQKEKRFASGTPLCGYLLFTENVADPNKSSSNAISRNSSPPSHYGFDEVVSSTSVSCFLSSPLSLAPLPGGTSGIDSPRFPLSIRTIGFTPISGTDSGPLS